MKAVCVNKFGGLKVLEVQENLPLPPISDTEVLVKILAAGVNPVDTYIREGQFANLPELPFTPGKDGSGIIEKVGVNVTRFQKGDRVFVCIRSGHKYGTYAEYAVADESETFPLDDSLSFNEGAAIGIAYFTAYRALFQKGHAVAGDTVLVHGASGAVGLASVQLAKMHGMSVIGTAGTPDGMNVVKENGADHVLCHRDKSYLEKLAEITDNKGVDIIVEMLSNVNLGKDLQLLAPKGRVLIVGCRGSVSINPRFMMSPETMIIGVALLSSTKEEWNEITSNVLKGIKEKKLVPVVDKCYSLDQCQSAQDDIIRSKGAKGKLVISMER